MERTSPPATGKTLLEAKVIRDNAPYLRPHIPPSMLDFFDKLVETALTLEISSPSTAGELAMASDDYDSKCLELAEHFLADSFDPTRARNFQEKLIVAGLALAIQEAVEDYLREKDL